MKLIIDINESTLAELTKYGEPLPAGNSFQDSILSAVANGKPYKERSQGEWIPVSERMPNNHEYIKNNGLFNVSDGNRSYSEWFDIYETEMFGEPTISGFRVDNMVIAWQPLPEPYKENADNE